MRCRVSEHYYLPVAPEFFQIDFQRSELFFEFEVLLFLA